MARIKYYYDTETCSFKKAKLDRRTLIRSSVVYSLFSVCIGTLAVYYMMNFHDNPATRRLKEQNALLGAQIGKFDEAVMALESDLKALHDKDQAVYRSILKADPLQDQWKQASAGAADKSSYPVSMEETKDRLEAIDNRVQVQKQSFKRLMGMMKGKEEELQHMPSIRPVETDVISGFGYRLHPILKVKKLHTGIDFSAAVGTPVYATADGRVKFSGRGTNGYGLQVDIAHGYGWETKYAHLSKITVPEGKQVKRGDLIGFSGNSGLSKGPHLHYEIKKDGRKIDPVDYFYSDLTPEAYIDFKRQANQYNESMD